MTKQEALLIVNKIFSSFSGNRADHIKLQEVEEFLKTLVEPQAPQKKQEEAQKNKK